MVNKKENEKLEFLQDIDRVWKLSVNEMFDLFMSLSFSERENLLNQLRK